MSQTRILIERRFEILQILSFSHNGTTIKELLEQVGCSRATLYRDLEFLESFLPIVRQAVGDNRRISLLGSGQPTTLKVEELAALRFAREMVQPLKGKWEVDTLDRLLRKLGRDSQSIGCRELSKKETIVKSVDSAIRNDRRISFHYTSATNIDPVERIVDPLALRLHHNFVYLIGYDVTQSDLRIYKLSRLQDNVVAIGDADTHSEFNEEKLFTNSSGIWTGDDIEVKIRIQSHKARFVNEWPLTQSQTIAVDPNGDLLITATVSGLQEPLRWLLSWGAAATAIAPDEFRLLAEQEICEMASNYVDAVST